MAPGRSRSLAFLHELRGLRVQLLLWTILPLTVVLVALSLLSITRHRQAMTQLVEDRNRGLTLGEANRLAREIDSRASALAQVGASFASGAPHFLGSLPDSLLRSFPSGFALMDATPRSFRCET
jgi:hypothetical protein